MKKMIQIAAIASVVVGVCLGIVIGIIYISSRRTPDAPSEIVANEHHPQETVADAEHITEPQPPAPSEIALLFDDGFSHHAEPNLAGWTGQQRVTEINSVDHAPMAPAIHYATISTNNAVMHKPISLYGHRRYRLSAWVRGGGGEDTSGVFITHTIGTRRATTAVGCGINICHNVSCCEIYRIARIVAEDLPTWQFIYYEFELHGDFDGEVMIRSWRGGPLYVSDIRIEVLHVFDTYNVTYSASEGGTITAAFDELDIPEVAVARPGTSVTFTAAPDFGYTVERWEANGTITGGGNSFTTQITDDTDIRVFFREGERVMLTYNVSGPGEITARVNGRTDIESGTIVNSGNTVAEGYSLAFLVAPEAGYEVGHWVVNGLDVQYIGRLLTVANVRGVGAAGTLTYDVQVVLQPIDPTGGRFDPNSTWNTTNRGRMGININRDGGLFTGEGLDAQFNETMLASMAPFGLIRFMNYTNTNNHFHVHDWSDVEAGMWGEIVALANAANTDIWICIPANASDDYIRALAELMEQNLNPYIRVYVEWGNEIWGFEPQRLVNERMIYERGIPEDRRNIWAAHELWWNWSHYFHFAQRTAEIAFIFRDVFNEDYRDIDHNSRVRPVLTWQVIPNAFVPMFEWLNGTTDTPFHSDEKFRNPHTYLWALGIAPYFSEPNSAMATDVEYIHSGMQNSMEGQRDLLQAIVDSAANLGLLGGAVTYEGGPHHVGDGSINMDIRAAAQSHPLMVDLMSYYVMNTWLETGGNLFIQYRHLGAPSPWGHWGVKNTLTLEQFKFNPKYQALSWISRQPRGTTVHRPEVSQAQIFELQLPALNASVEVPTNTDLVLTFWHRGATGCRVIIRTSDGREYYVTANSNEDWTMDLVSFYTGVATEIELIIDRAGSESEFDFFHLDQNLIYNPSFVRGMDGWSHGFGWIGAQSFELADELLHIFGEVTPDGLNASQFRLAAETQYRLIFHHMGDGGVMAQIPMAGVEVVTEQNAEWRRYQTVFSSHGTALSGNVMLSAMDTVGQAFLDNFILIPYRVPAV